MPIALAGGVHATILSIVGLELLPFFSTLEACTLRLVCREFVGAIADVRWNDIETVINGDLSKWRACFPRARTANVFYRKDLVDADFVHLQACKRCTWLSATSPPSQMQPLPTCVAYTRCT